MSLDYRRIIPLPLAQWTACIKRSFVCCLLPSSTQGHGQENWILNQEAAALIPATVLMGFLLVTSEVGKRSGHIE